MLGFVLLCGPTVSVSGAVFLARGLLVAAQLAIERDAVDFGIGSCPSSTRSSSMYPTARAFGLGSQPQASHAMPRILNSPHFGHSQNGSWLLGEARGVCRIGGALVFVQGPFDRIVGAAVAIARRHCDRE